MVESVRSLTSIRVGDNPMKKFLVAEYSDSDIREGWHLYVRDSDQPNQRNNDGGWGWIRNIKSKRHLLNLFGIKLKGDGTLDLDGIAQFAERFKTDSMVCGRYRGVAELDD